MGSSEFLQMPFQRLYLCAEAGVFVPELFQFVSKDGLLLNGAISQMAHVTFAFRTGFPDYK